MRADLAQPRVELAAKPRPHDDDAREAAPPRRHGRWCRRVRRQVPAHQGRRRRAAAREDRRHLVALHGGHRRRVEEGRRRWASSRSPSRSFPSASMRRPGRSSARCSICERQGQASSCACKDGKPFVTDSGNAIIDVATWRHSAIPRGCRQSDQVNPRRGRTRPLRRHLRHHPDGHGGRREDIPQGMTGFDYDLFVIGAGSGGVRAARIAARYGAKVAVAEEYRVGGTCVIRGCVPKKLFVYASKFAEEFEDAVGFGWTSEKVSFDWADAGRQQGQGDRPAQQGLYPQSRRGGRRADPRTRRRRRTQHRACSHPAARSRRATFLLPPERRPSCRAIFPVMSWRSPPTRPFISNACRRASASSAAATSPSNSPGSSPASASRPY